jgi:hypothetical protein
MGRVYIFDTGVHSFYVQNGCCFGVGFCVWDDRGKHDLTVKLQISMYQLQGHSQFVQD